MSETSLVDWLDAHADRLDEGTADPAEVLPRLAAADVLGVGVSAEQGGGGGRLSDAVEAIANVASHSLTAAFVFWGQRSMIEYVLQSPNADLRARLLGDLLSGKLAGASGLSNAMKFLAGIESLQIRAETFGTDRESWRVNGVMPWVTNLRPQNFIVAAVVERSDGQPPFVAAISGKSQGLVRSDDLRLLGLQSSNTAAIKLDDVVLNESDLLHIDAPTFLPLVRPAFLGLQCAMSIGLARRSLDEAQQRSGDARRVLGNDIHRLRAQLESHVSELLVGLDEGSFVRQPAKLFRLRIALAEAASAAVQFELQAGGGAVYLQPRCAGFARRWREVAFVPLITPSLVQLRTELQRHVEAVV
jgi:alkylation response protein AidB-like acyl-CoA dehydrogenase